MVTEMEELEKVSSALHVAARIHFFKKFQAHKMAVCGTL